MQAGDPDVWTPCDPAGLISALELRTTTTMVAAWLEELQAAGLARVREGAVHVDEVLLLPVLVVSVAVDGLLVLRPLFDPCRYGESVALTSAALVPIGDPSTPAVDPPAVRSSVLVCRDLDTGNGATAVRVVPAARRSGHQGPAT